MLAVHFVHCCVCRYGTTCTYCCTCISVPARVCRQVAHQNGGERWIQTRNTDFRRVYEKKKQVYTKFVCLPYTYN